MEKRNDPTGFRELLGLISQTDAACLELDWLRAIELYKKALTVLPAELNQSHPHLPAEILKAIGHCYYALGKPKEADKYFARAIRFIKSSADFEADGDRLEPYFDRPLRELPFEIEGLPFTDEPYNGLVVPEVLPLLQHTVHMLRPYGINVHAWMFKTVVAMQKDAEVADHKFLPDCLPASEIERLRKPRRYNPDEAVMLRGQDGYLYKLVAPGKLTKVRGRRK
jgi:tetratricopeptide (TPR) repeat protein